MIRGPWTDRPPAPPDSDHAVEVHARELERQAARRDLRGGTEASRLYQRLVVLIGGPDAVEITNVVLDRLAEIDDDELLRAVIRQRLAGHRIR